MKTKLLIFVTLLIASGGTLATIGDVWDAGADWDWTTSNGPVWDYLGASNNYLLLNTLPPNYCAAAWSNSGNAGGVWDAPNVYSWYPAYNQGSPINLSDPNQFGGHGKFVVRWTSPVAGLVRVSGNMAQTSSEQRVQHWQLLKNGVVFTEGFQAQTALGHAVVGQVMDFASGSAGTGGLYVQVAVGDTIGLTVDGTPQALLPVPYIAPPAYEVWATFVACNFRIEQVDPASVTTYTLTMGATPAGAATGVSPASGSSYVEGTNVQVSAADEYIGECPDTGYVFDHWEGDVTMQGGKAYVTMDGDKTVTAVYVDSGPCLFSWICGQEFSAAANPNGVWSYYTWPGQVLMISGNGNLGGPPVGWKNPDPGAWWEGLYGYPGGDLAEPNDLGGHNPWMVRWTSPIDGWVRVSGQSYQRAWDNGKRLMKWTLRHNGAEFNHGYGKQNPTTGQPLLGQTNAASFEDGVGGSTGLYRQVSVGDTIDLVTTGTPLAEFPIPYAAGEPYGTVNICQFALSQVDEGTLPLVNLTVVANPGIVDSSVSPTPGTYPYVVGTQAPIMASEYIDCPTVMAFSNWTGAGVANPTAASTTVDMSTDRTVTAVYVDNRQCGDVCHPTWPDVPTDLNSDCRTNLADFAILAADWMNSTSPNDD